MLTLILVPIKYLFDLYGVDCAILFVFIFCSCRSRVLYIELIND